MGLRDKAPVARARWLPATCLACAGMGTGPVLAQSARGVETAEEVSNDADGLDEIVVSGQRSQTLAVPVDRIGQTIGRRKLDGTNIVNPEDALKYVPNLVVRKRFIGDTNGSISIRGTNMSQPARVSVFLDGLPLSNFLGNDSDYSPRWGLVAPDEIQSIDVMYGPYSAQYSGNTIGAGIFITSRMPEKLEISANVLGALHQFRRYGTHQDLDTHQVQAGIGDKVGNVAWSIFGDYIDAEGQTARFQSVPVASGSTTLPGVQVTGAVRDVDYLGVDRWIIGALGPTTNRQGTIKGKAAWDIDAGTRLFATVAYRDRSQKYLSPESYLRDSGGDPVLTGRVRIGDRSYTISTLANLQRGIVELEDILGGMTFQKRLGPGLTVETIGSVYEILSADTRTNFVNESRPRVNKTDRAGWRTVSGTLTWRADDRAPILGQKLVVGGDYRYYFIHNTTTAPTDWQARTVGPFVERSGGKTETFALFGENSWTLVPRLQLTLGLRWDRWRAFDGDRRVGAVTLPLGSRRDDAWQPKAVLTWKPDEPWTIQAQAAKATRFPTVQELFQSITSGGELVQGDPNLRPERATTFNLSAAREISLLGGSGRVSVAGFHDTVDDTLYFLQNFANAQSYYQNVARVRTKGVDASINVGGLLDGVVDLYANLTRQRGVTVRNAAVPGSDGKDFPRTPRWRANFLTTIHVTDRFAASGGFRYEGKQFTDFLNLDDHKGGADAFTEFFLADAKLAYDLTRKVEASFGIDNLLGYRAFVGGHPLPGRTFVASLRVRP